MKKGVLAILILFVCISSVWCETPEKEGKKILTNSDLRFFPDEGTYEMLIGEIGKKGEKVLYNLQIYKKGKTNLTSVWVFPDVMKNNVSIRTGDTIYYKALKATKPDIMSFQSLFLDSGFSWADVLGTDLVDDYKAVKIEKVKEGGTDCFFLQLEPLKKDRYARIDVWIDQNTFDSKRRIYYTPSGDKLKEAVYSAIKVEGGAVIEFRIDVEDFFMGTTNYAIYSKIKKEKLPQFFFDVQNISRIHMR